MKKITLFLTGLLICSLSVFGGGGAESGTIKVGALFAETGPASFLGAPEAKTVRMVAEEINAAGGINGKKIELVIKDTQASSEKAISMAKQLIEEDQVLAIIGPSTSGETIAIKDICQDAKTPLISCAAAEAIVEPVLPYIFKTPQKDSYAARHIYLTMKAMGVSKIGILTANTGFGNGGKDQLTKYAPEYGIDIVIAESYESTATDLTAVLTKINEKNVQAVVNWSIVDAQSIIPKNMKQLNMTIPLFQSHGFGNIKYVEVAGEAANGIIFPCGKLLIAKELPDSDPQKALLVKYKNDYETKYNEAVSTFGGHAYDALMIVIEAYKRGGTDRAKLRDQIEKLTNFPGTGGVFSYSPTEHNGLPLESLTMLTVKNGQFTLYK